MKNVKADFDSMHLPFLRQFITGDMPNNDTVEIPESTLYIDDENGNRTLPFGQNGRGRLLNELYKFYNSEDLPADVKPGLAESINIITAFLKDIRLWHDPSTVKAFPRIEYRMFAPSQLVFYPDHTDPDFIEYRRQLAVYHELEASSKEIPDQLINWLNGAENDLFFGPIRAKARMTAVMSMLEKHLDSLIVGYGIMAILYNPEELAAINAETERNVQEFKKAKRTRVPPTPTSFKISGHLVDQTLKYSYITNNKIQPSLFDSLAASTQRTLLAAGVDRDTVVEGIQVTPTENKVIVALSKLLHRKSQTSDPAGKDYYSGMQLPSEIRGRKPTLPNYQDGTEQIAPEIVVTLHELAREFIGGKAPGGKEYTNVKNTLFDLAKKQFLINYTQTTPLENGKQLKETIQEYQNLIKVRKYNATITDNNNAIESSNDEILISLNPIFRHSIASKFIIVPSDYLKRLTEAYGSSNVSAATMQLANYLIREKCSNRVKAEIGLDRLHQLLCSKWVREGRRAKVIEFTEKAINTVKNLQLVTHHEVVSAKSLDGQKVVFYLNKNWPESA